MSWIHLKGHWYHPLSSNCSEELGDTQSLYSRPLNLDEAFALPDQMQMSLGLWFGLSLAIPHIRKVHQSLYETCTSTSAKLMMQWANSKKIRTNYFYNTFTCLPMFWINIPQIDVLPAPCYLQFSCDAAAETDHTWFPNPSSMIVHMLLRSGLQQITMYLHKQTCTSILFKWIHHIPSLPKWVKAIAQLSRFLHGTIKHKHPTSYQEQEVETILHSDHPSSLPRFPLALILAKSLASLTHGLTLHWGSLCWHALSTGRKTKKYKWLCAICCKRGKFCQLVVI